MSTKRTAKSAGVLDVERFRSGQEAPRGPNGRLLCRQCGTEVPPRRQTFCSKPCVHDWQMRTNPGYVRIQVAKRDHGVCALCGKDTVADLPPYWRDRARGTGHLWQADHIVPVVEGGGECGLDNYRTLCTACHKAETKELHGRLKKKRAECKPLPLIDSFHPVEKGADANEQ